MLFEYVFARCMKDWQARSSWGNCAWWEQTCASYDQEEPCRLGEACESQGTRRTMCRMQATGTGGQDCMEGV
jgi:hypothetical protein